MEGTSSTRVVLVTDLAGSTALNDRLGDGDYLALLREHDTIVGRELARTDGVQFKHTGDGIAAWFYSVNNALDCADALAVSSRPRGPVRAIATRREDRALAGEPALVDGDLLGLSVTVAFRVLEHAQPGEVLVTSDVAAWRAVSHGRSTRAAAAPSKD